MNSIRQYFPWSTERVLNLAYIVSALLFIWLIFNVLRIDDRFTNNHTFSFPTFKRIHAPTAKQLYILTATYNRLEQLAELTRLCHTFLHVKNIHWIVVEDAIQTSIKVEKLLQRCGVPFTLLNAKTLPEEEHKPREPRWLRPRGIAQRNRGLRWIRENLVTHQDEGVLYIADDDNTYSLRLFDEIQSTKRVSTWPVAFAGGLPWEGCVTSPSNPDVIERMWTVYKPWRTFPVDMAGFAVNLELLLSRPNVEFSYTGEPGMLETEFLIKLGLRNFTELEPKADGCKRILVWHTQTVPPHIAFDLKQLRSRMPNLFPDEL